MSYTSLFYHIVFSTKQRRRMLREPIRQRVIEYVGGIVRNLKGQLLRGGGHDDHLHLVTVLHPTSNLSQFISKLKSNSTRWIRNAEPALGAFEWQDEYAAFTVSRSALPRVLRYVEK